MEKSQGIFEMFVSEAKCSGRRSDGCVWLGLEQKDDQHGTQYHFDYWPNSCGSGFRNWYPGQPSDQLGYSQESQDCVMMGFWYNPQWWDVNCTGYKSACVCETGGRYHTGGGGGGGAISGFGVFMLILVFGMIFFVPCGFYYGRPEKKAEHIAILKAKLGTERARTGTTTSTGMGAGLAANDSCSTSYVAPVTPPLSTASICAVTPGTTASNA